MTTLTNHTTCKETESASFACVEIYFKDEPDSPLEVDFSLSLNVVEDEDMDIFYYISGTYELDQMIEAGTDTMNDFVVTDYETYS